MFPLHPRRVPSGYPTTYDSIDAPPSPPNPPSPAFNPIPDLILQTAPPLDPAWLAHEAALPPPPPGSAPPVIDPKLRQEAYSQACKDRNAYLLSSKDAHLNHRITILDAFIDNSIPPTSHEILFPPTVPRTAPRPKIPIRSYNPSFSPGGPPPVYRDGKETEEEGKDIVIYYHGGGLYVGDLNSEDLTCRRLCLSLSCTVYSVEYRLMPQCTADDAVADAMEAFRFVTATRKARKLVVMGSSSGGMLAAMVANRYRVWNGPLPARAPPVELGLRWRGGRGELKIHGVCLRGPVTCDATEGGENLPAKFRQYHTSMGETFHTSLLSVPALDNNNRTTAKLPLEANSFDDLPRHYVQVCTNDIYYSDGVLYGEALREAGVEVRLDVLEGWPHTFWLKAPELERTVQAERECVEGVRWLFESEVGGQDEVAAGEETQERGKGKEVEGPGGFVPFSDEWFERRFNE